MQPSPLSGIHHSAFRCRDAQATRAFYEGVLGLPLAAVVHEQHEPGSNRPHPFVHLFFRLPDGNFIAFFDAPSSVTPDSFRPVHGFDRHIAFETDSEESLIAWRDRLNNAGHPCFGPIDHGFVRSVYFTDPDGLPLEITRRVDAHDAILAKEAQAAPAILAAWADAKTSA